MKKSSPLLIALMLAASFSVANAKGLQLPTKERYLELNRSCGGSQLASCNGELNYDDVNDVFLIKNSSIKMASANGIDIDLNKVMSGKAAAGFEYVYVAYSTGTKEHLIGVKKVNSGEFVTLHRISAVTAKVDNLPINLAKLLGKGYGVAANFGEKYIAFISYKHVKGEPEYDENGDPFTPARQQVQIASMETGELLASKIIGSEKKPSNNIAPIEFLADGSLVVAIQCFNAKKQDFTEVVKTITKTEKSWEVKPDQLNSRKCLPPK